jgi:tRNA A-37 threonylcarbamoyl transferase component Bud32
VTEPGGALDALVDRLAQRGVIPTAEGTKVEVLSGGVSADVVLVTSGGRRVVVKRALPRLRVAKEWVSSPSRVVLEAAALEAARGIRPKNVPAVLDLDEERLVLALECAPPDAANWKQQLLQGTIDPGIGGWLGSALADWHTKSAADRELTARFAHHTYFFDLRISPFFLSTAEVHPDLAAQIHEVVDRMSTRRECLVHGDFSPKNVLFGRDWFWVVDWETAHRGDPTFDVAFLLCHLVCKAVHRPGDAERYRACAEHFLGSYRSHTAVVIDDDWLGPQIGCLLLARVDGKSPVDYLDEPEKDTVRAIGRRVLEARVTDLAELWPDATPTERVRP